MNHRKHIRAAGHVKRRSDLLPAGAAVAHLAAIQSAGASKEARDALDLHDGARAWRDILLRVTRDKG